MASTFYEDGGPTATTTDSVNRYHQNHLKVEWTSDDEQITYTLTAYARSGNGTGYYYCSGYGVTVTLYYNLNGEGGVKLNSASGTLNYNNNVAYVTKSVTFNRTHSRQTIQFGAGNTGNSLNSAWHTTGEDSFAALKSYSISYNKNSDNTVSNGPANQTKGYNENLTITSTKPTKPTTTQYTYTATFNSNYPTAANTNNYIETATVIGSTSYTFNKGATVSASTGGTLYNSGATYTPNTAATLYPRWTSSTSSPSITFKAYSLPNYTFQGGSTSSTGTNVTYTPGATYTPTASSNVTGYGHGIINYKPPTINDEITAIRTTNDGTEFNEGTYCKISVNGIKGDGNISEIKWIIKQQNTIVVSETTTNIATTATSANKILSGVDSTKSYTIEVTITDTNNLSATKTTILSPAFFTLDILQGGEGIAIGKPATEAILDIAFPTKITNTTTTALNVDGNVIIDGALNANDNTTINGTLTLNNYPIDFRNFGANPITETANDTVANWVALGSGYAMYNQSILSQQPVQYGILLNFVAPNKSDVFQLWHTQRAGNLFVRGGNSSGGFDYWCDIGGPQYTDGTITRNTNNCSTLGTSWISKKGYIVSVSFIDSKITNALASGSDVVIATLPSGYRPRANRYLQCVEKAGLGARITASGEVRISNRTGASYAAGSTMTFSDSFGAV